MAMVAEKKDEKLEKRRALGRGLESLLPGPRAVAPAPPPPADPTLPAKTESGGTPSATAGSAAKLAVAAAPEALPGQHSAGSLEAQATPGNLVVNLEIDSIQKNPYQTRSVFDEQQLIELRD